MYRCIDSKKSYTIPNHFQPPSESSCRSNRKFVTNLFLNTWSKKGWERCVLRKIKNKFPLNMSESKEGGNEVDEKSKTMSGVEGMISLMRWVLSCGVPLVRMHDHGCGSSHNWLKIFFFDSTPKSTCESNILTVFINIYSSSPTKDGGTKSQP